jgi:hypothetical protein
MNGGLSMYVDAAYNLGLKERTGSERTLLLLECCIEERRIVDIQ